MNEKVVVLTQLTHQSSQSLYKRRYGCSNFTRVDIFAIDPLSVYILIDVVHRLIKCTEIYISA